MNTRFRYDPHQVRVAIDPRGLSGLRTRRGALVGEGSYVQLMGRLMIARDEHPETVNCHGSDGMDIHISISDKPSAPRTEFDGVVVEMIPQLDHPPGWDSATLNGLAKTKRIVLVAGSLTYDNEHYLYDDPDHPSKQSKSQPKRASLWEIHPIVKFFVCDRESCDPTKHDDWATLSGWSKTHPR